MNLKNKANKALGRLGLYYETQWGALGAAISVVEQFGYSVEEFLAVPVSYETSTRYHLATNDPKTFLHLHIYRMPSGRYELTAYLN